MQIPRKCAIRLQYSLGGGLPKLSKKIDSQSCQYNRKGGPVEYYPKNRVGCSPPRPAALEPRYLQERFRVRNGRFKGRGVFLTDQGFCIPYNPIKFGSDQVWRTFLLTNASFRGPKKLPEWGIQKIGSFLARSFPSVYTTLRTKALVPSNHHGY
jgi:hypothetical protein